MRPFDEVMALLKQGRVRRGFGNSPFPKGKTPMQEKDQQRRMQMLGGGAKPPTLRTSPVQELEEDNVLDPETGQMIPDFLEDGSPNPAAGPAATIKSMRPFDHAWQLLKGDYDQDMQVMQALGGQNTAGALAQNPVPAAYQGDPEGWATDYMSNVSNMQGTLAANVGNPNFNLAQHLQAPVALNATEVGERIRAKHKEYEENQRRMAELDFIARQAQFEGHPRFRNYGQ